MRLPAVVVLLSVLCSSRASAQEIRSDVTYVKRGRIELKLDIALPKKEGRMRPALLCFHGGGWVGGDKGRFKQLLPMLAQQGYVAVSVQYRLAGIKRWPAQLDDVRDAMKWVLDHADELGIDRERIGVLGESAGAQLAMMLGYQPKEDSNEVRVRAVANLFGPTDMRQKEEIKRGRPLVEALIGKNLDEDVGDILKEISPATFVDRTDPPTMTVHGEKDTLVPFNQAEIIRDVLKKTQIPGQFMPLAGTGHGYGRNYNDVMARVAKFGASYLLPPKMPLVAYEDFEKGTKQWEFTDEAAWKLDKVDRRSFISLTVKKSDYQPKVRSPHNIALLKSKAVRDFVLDVDMRSTNEVYGHQDLCVFFGHQDASHFYYVHLGRKADAHANSIFLVNGKPRVSIAKERTDGTDWSRGWHRVRIKRDVKSGAIEVFFDDMDKPVMKTIDKTFKSGRVGIGSFDDKGDFDAIRLWGHVTK